MENNWKEEMNKIFDNYVTENTVDMVIEYEDVDDFKNSIELLMSKVFEANKQICADADERFKKAYDNIVWKDIPKEIDKKQLEINLKLAAYGTSD